MVKPLYPVGQLNRRESAKVEVHTRILHDGAVVADHVTGAGSLDSQFTAAALAAARLGRYYPALKNGCPVTVYMTVTVTFDAN